MALTESFRVQLDSKPPDFSLQGVDQQIYDLKHFDGASILVVVFMCNHCPYVQACIDRLVQLQRDFADRGVRFVGINSNDSTDYPEDSFDAMKDFSLQHAMNFPYLIDEKQEIAHKYHAVCTPDIFVYDKERKLRYHGRIDNNWKDVSKVTSHDLRNALGKLTSGQKPDDLQYPSMGCSIKWKQ